MLDYNSCLLKAKLKAESLFRLQNIYLKNPARINESCSFIVFAIKFFVIVH